jgi:purine-binding chemotaxis protein CheW
MARRALLLRNRTEPVDSARAPLVCLGFNKSRQRYGIPVEHVLEVQALDRFTSVPKTPAFIAGVVHWRGAILALLDLGALFGVPEAGLSDVHVCVIVEAAGRRMGVIAYEVEEVYSFARKSIAAAPPLPGALPPEWLIGVQDNQRMILNMALILGDARLVEWINKS